jgi:ClpP class serine protease
MTKTIPYPLRGDWLITEEGADLILSVWKTAHTVGQTERIALALEQRGGQPFNNDRRCSVNDGIAVMEIDGPLMRKAELFSDISGATSYQWIGATVDQLRADPNVRKVVIKVNSPGGEAAGVGECAEKIARLAAEKHVEGYVETQAASAALWLLVQCSHVTAHATAQIGWIGAVRRLRDTSAQDQKEGVRELEFVSKGAEKKRTTPLDKAVMDRVQRGVDKWGSLFTEAVAKGRGVTTDKVLSDFGGGDGMFADRALTVGLIDAIGDLESTFAGLAGVAPAGGITRASRVRAGASMKTENDTTAAAASAAAGAADAPEWQCAGCNEMMGPSAKAYCAKCSEDDGDEDGEDEDEAKALGLDGKALASVRRARMVDLAGFEASVLEATGAKTRAQALALIANGAAALEQLPALRSNGRTRDMRAMLEAGLQGAPGKQPTLSLGIIQKSMARVLRGDVKKAWLKAMADVADKAEAAAKANDAENATVTAAQIVEAACAVAPALSDEDMEALTEFAGSCGPIAAANHIEPPRDGETEASSLDEQVALVDKYAAKARATLDRNNKSTAA